MSFVFHIAVTAVLLLSVYVLAPSGDGYLL